MVGSHGIVKKRERMERERMEREKESHIQSRAKRMSFVGVQTAPVLYSRAV